MAFFPPSVPFTAQAPQICDTVALAPTSVTGSTFAVQTYTVSNLDPIKHQFIDIGLLPFNTATGAQVAQTASMYLINAWCSAANTLSILWYNAGSTGSPVTGNYSYVVF